MSASQLNTLLHCLRQIVNLTHAITEEQKLQQQLHQHHGETVPAHALKLLNTTTTMTMQDDHNHAHDHAPDHAHDHEHDHNNESSEGLVLAKITAILVLFLASSLCGSIPFLIERFWRFKKNNKNKNETITSTSTTNSLITDPHATTIVKCLLYFGGGVLLCTTFIHLLPEVQENVEQLTECGLLPDFPFPLAELLMCLGFFLMYFIEEIIHTYIHYAANNKTKNKNNNKNKMNEVDDDENMGVVAFARGHSIRRSCLLNGSKNKIKEAATTTTATTTTATETTTSTATTSPPPTTTTKPTIKIEKNHDEIKTISTHDLITYDVEQAKYNEHQQQQQEHNHHLHHSHYHGHRHNVVPNNISSSSTTKPTTNREDFSASLRGLFIVLALSIHELFEGMAIGLESSTASVWVMFGAVSAHKLVLAFCVGVELIVAQTKLNLAILYCIAFAIVSPLGIAIGIIVSNADISGSGSNVVSVYLQGVACGTLLYVVFFEILSKNYAGLKALFALIAGFCIMFALNMLGEGEHQHSHGSCTSVSEVTTKATSVDPATTTNSVPHNALGLEEQLKLLREASAQLLELHTQKKS